MAIKCSHHRCYPRCHSDSVTAAGADSAPVAACASRCFGSDCATDRGQEGGDLAGSRACAPPASVRAVCGDIAPAAENRRPGGGEVTQIQPAASLGGRHHRSSRGKLQRFVLNTGLIGEMHRSGACICQYWQRGEIPERRPECCRGLIKRANAQSGRLEERHLLRLKDEQK